MHIQTLSLQNFRGFEEKTIDFHPQFNVLIGENGSGKTTILDAINLALQKFIHLLDDGEKQRDFIQKNDVKIGQRASGIVAKIAFGSNEEVIEIFTDKTKINKANSQSLEQFLIPIRHETPPNIPILSYYTWNRLSNIVNDRNDKTINIKGEYDAYYKAFSTSNYMYQDFLNWFEMGENYENDTRLKVNINFRHPDLEAVRGAISLFLSKLSGVEMGNLTIKRTFDAKEFGEVRNDTADLILKKNGQELSFSQLSSGEKNILMLIADIARKLTVANRIPIRTALHGYGIILIDEIDIHLHPSWQRKILPALHHTFPNIQFIVTTHSPLIIQEMKKEEIVFLDKTPDYEPNLLTPDSILMRIQGLPDIETPERKEKLQELAKIDIAITELKKQGKDNPAKIQQLWNRFQKIAKQLDWKF